MTTPRDTLSDIWSEAVNSYPELGQKYGTDPSKISLAGLRHYKKLRASRPTTPAYALPPSAPPSAPASAPASVLPPAPPVPGTPVPSPDDSKDILHYLTGDQLDYLARYRRGEIPDSILNKWRPLAEPRYDTGEPAVDPEPVDWDKRKKDFFDMLKDFGMGIINPFHETEAKRALPNEASWWQKVKANFEPQMRGIGAWTETFKPGAGHLSRPLIPGVRRRYNELRDRGHGPMASAQAAFEQSAGAGEIPLFQQIASEAVTDPVELLPGVGIAGGVTRGAARALPRVAGRAALAKAAPDVAKAPVSISPDVAARPAPQPVQAMMPLQPSIFDDVPIETTTPAARFASSASGLGTVELGLRKGSAVSVHVDEFDPDIIKAFNEAHGTNYTPRDIADDASLQLLIASNAKHYHASPVCKNLSAAKVGRNLDPNDIAIAGAVERNIREVKPPTITIENVPDYMDTDLFKGITNSLDEAGYKWDVDVYDAADYGAAQTRKRMIVRAVLDGELPPLPQKTAPEDWYASLEDLIEVEFTQRPLTIDKAFKPSKRDTHWEIDRIDQMIEKGSINPNEPIFTMGGSAGRGTANARNAGGPGPTLMGSPKQHPRIIRKKKDTPLVEKIRGNEEFFEAIDTTPEMWRRYMGLAEDVALPDPSRFHPYKITKQVLGNGVHGKITENIIQPLVDTPVTPVGPGRFAAIPEGALPSPRVPDVAPAPAADAFPAPQSIQSISFGDVKAGDVVDITMRQRARGWRPPHAVQSPTTTTISGKVGGVGTSEIAGKSSRHISINGEIIPEDVITDIQIKTIPTGFPDAGFMPADELLGRQQAEAAQAAKEWRETPEVFRKGIPKPPEPEDWQSRVPAGRPDWMSRRGQDSLIPITEKERTGQLSLLGDWTDVGKDIVEVSSPHRYDTLVPGDMMDVVNKMVEAIQKGVTHLPGHNSAFTAKVNRLSEAMFGTVKKRGWNAARQKKELANNRAKVVEYVESLGSGRNKFDLGDYGSQGKLDLDSPKPWIKKNEHKVEMDRWLEEYYTFSTERNMWIRKTDRPITTTSRGMKSAVEESELAQLMNDTVPAGIGDLVENVKKEAEKAGEQISSWVENVNFGLGMPKLLDDAQANIKELTSRLIIPSEQNSIKGIKGFLTGGRAPAEIDTFMRRFFGNEQLNKELLNDIAARGRTEMQELGWVDSRGVVTELGWGTADTPGPVRLLHRALHEKGKALEEFKQATGPSGMRQYWNLRILAGQEEVLTKAVLNPRDPDFKLMNSEDYFYRGMRLDSDITGDAASETFHVGTLGRKQSYQLSRSHKTYTELENAGYVPLFQNPYDQAMFRARMGFHTRIQMQLLDALKDPSVNMAKRVWDDMEKAALRADGWRTVENTGPALKGDKGMWVPKKNEAIPNAEEDAVLHHSEWFFPENVAKVMEEMFAPKKPLWKALRSEKFIPVLNVTVKLDDLFFIPKRANLFGSLFQQVDFAVRMTASIWQQSVVHPVFDSMHLIGKGDIEGSFKQFLIGTAGAPQSIFWRIPKALTKMGWANLSPGYRDVLRKRLMSSKPILPGEEFKEYTWENFVRNGLHVRDDTIFLGENLTPIWQQARDEVMLVKGLKAVPRALKHVEGAMQKGLFDGVYPAAIMQDVEKNLLPLVRALNPDLNPDQVMGTVAYLANLKWSTIPAHQSVFRGHLKEGLTRIAFSLNEFEAIGRQTTGMLRGEHKRFWVEYGASVITFTALMGGLIHFTTTSLTKTKDGKLKPDFKMGKWLPMDRYIPFWSRSYHKLGFGYNSKFLSPDIPVLTRSGDRAMLDLLNQLDFFFRITDGTNGFPLTGFFNSRLGSMPRALINQGRGKDYMGKDISEWGYGQRALQFVYDSLAPIGAGQLAVALAREAMKERYVPGQGFGAAPPLGLETPLIQEGAKARHILPSIEARLGLGGIAVQAVGLNLKAVRTEDIKDEMVRNVFGKAGGHHDFPDLVLKSWQELSRHPEKTTLAKIVFQDIRNITRNKEISLRQEEGYEQFYDGFSKYIYERRQIAKERLKKQADIVNEQTKMLWNPSLTEAWSPSTFKEKLRAINANYQAKIAGLEKVYREDPAVAARFKEWETKAPDRAEDPLDWAIYRYFKIRKEAADTITGKLDYNKFKTLWAKETAQWDDEEAKESGGLLERFDVWQNQSQQHPFVEEYYDALKRIEDSGYWNDLDNDIMQRLEQVYPNARQVWSEYLIASVEERRRLASHADFGIQTVIKTMDKARKANRYRMVMQNPELDRDLIKWFGNTPHLHENRMYFLELYGKLPSSIRKMPYK